MYFIQYVIIQKITKDMEGEINNVKIQSYECARPARRNQEESSS